MCNCCVHCSKRCVAVAVFAYLSACGTHVLQNIQELQRAAVQQQQQLEELQDRLTGLQENQAGLDKRIQDASQVWLLLITGFPLPLPPSFLQVEVVQALSQAQRLS